MTASLLNGGRPLELGRVIPLAAWKVLDVQILGQEQTNWCWAAVSLTVAMLYRLTVPPFTSQAALAGEFVCPGVDCTRTVPARCNQPFDLATVMSKLLGPGNCRVHSEEPSDWLTRITHIRTQIDRGIPIPCEFSVDPGQRHFPHGGFHYFLISGYRSSPGSEEVQIVDPQSPVSVTTVAELRRSLSGRAGRWTSTYYLEKSP